jgi:WD40 repeat protein
MNTPRAPYPGLRAFAQDEGDIFCGRSQHRIELLTKLEQSHFVAVLGASGSGKSSLVMAGLLRDISEGMLIRVPEGSSRIVYFKPGLNPFGSLAKALAKVVAFDRLEVEHLLRRSALGLGNVLELFAAGQHEDDAKLSKTSPAYVLVADQFEELFRFAALSKSETESTEFRQDRGEIPLLDGAHNEAQAFVDLLLEAAESTRHRIFVILTMRSDFLHHCEAFDRLTAAISASQYVTPRLNRDQLEDAITIPLKYFGASIDSSLVNWILNDLSPEQDQLPILQDALARMWWHVGLSKRAARLTVEHYRDVGGVADALNRHGGDILCEIDSDSKGAIKEAEVGRFFRCLSEYDPTGAPVRRARTVEQVVAESGLAPNEVRLIANRFRATGNHWLMPLPGAPGETLEDGIVLDLTHESLLRRWDKLAAGNGWMAIEKERRDTLLRVKERMIEATWPLGDTKPARRLYWFVRSIFGSFPISWAQSSRYRKVLCEPYESTRAWAMRYGCDWSATRLFLQAVAVRSFFKRSAMIAVIAVLAWLELKALIDKDLNKIQDFKNKAILAKTNADLTIAKAQAANEAAKREALEKRNESLVTEVEESKRTVEQIQNRLRGTEKIAAEANRIMPLAPRFPIGALAALEDALKQQGYLTANTTVSSPERQDVLSRAVSFQAHEKPVQAIAFLKIQRLLRLASGAMDQEIKLWQLDGTLDSVIVKQNAKFFANFGDSRLIIANEDPFLRIWSPSDRLLELKLSSSAPGEGVVNALPIPGGRILFGTTAGRVGIFTTSEIATTFLPVQENDRVNAIDYFADEQWLLASTDGGQAALWSIAGDEPKLLDSLHYQEPVRGASFDSRGELILVPTNQKQIDLFRLPSPPQGKSPLGRATKFVLTHQAPVTIGKFSPKGNLAATVDNAGRIYLWPLDSVRASGDAKTIAPVVLSGHSRRVTALQWSPDERFLVSGDEGGLILVWQSPAERVSGKNNGLPLVLPSHQDAVDALVVSSNGEFIASGGADRIVRLVPMFPTYAGPCRGGFGGPNDAGVSPSEGLALFDLNDTKDPTYGALFLRNRPDLAKLGLARRLNPDAFYVAARWDFSLTSRTFLRNNQVMVSNPKNGEKALAQPVDWGPNPSTGAVADLSPGLAKHLGLGPGDQVEVVVDLVAAQSK